MDSHFHNHDREATSASAGRLSGLLAGFVAITFAGCGPSWDNPNVETCGLLARVHGPPPERVWNRFGVWRQVGAGSASYIPKGCSPALVRTDPAGVWVDDKRDGKRLFVPSRGANGFSREALLAEARSITTWERNASYPYYDRTP